MVPALTMGQATGHGLEADLEEVRLHVGGAWGAFQGARILVTGGTGFVGTWLLESLLWANDRLALGAEVVALTRDAAAFRRARPALARAAGLVLHEGDVRTFAAPPGEFTHAVLAAASADASFNLSAPISMFETIVDGTRRTLEVLEGSGVRDVLFVSSGAVYGRQPPGLRHVDEEHAGGPDPLDPRSAYAEGKRAAEHLVTLHGREAGLRVRVARLFAFIGPHLPLDRHFAAGNFLRDRLAGRPIAVAGDGTPYRSYLYAADMATWLWTILARGEPGRAWNVGSERAVSIAELARTIAEAETPAVPVEIAQPAPAAGLLAERYVPSTRRARVELGLAAWVGLEEAVRRTLAWHRNMGNR